MNLDSAVRLSITVARRGTTQWLQCECADVVDRNCSNQTNVERNHNDLRSTVPH
jgi:hypothetical protein